MNFPLFAPTRSILISLLAICLTGCISEGGGLQSIPTAASFPTSEPVVAQESTLAVDTPMPTLTPTEPFTPSPTPTFTTVPTIFVPPVLVPTLTFTPTLTETPGTPSGSPDPTTPLPPTVTPTATVPSPTPLPIPDLGPLEKPPLISRAEWGARAPKAANAAQTPQRITVHMDGIYFGDTESAIVRVQSIQRFSMDSRKWNDIPYHFLIDRDGGIYEGLPVNQQGDSNTDYDTYGHVSLTLLGNFDEQAPSADQVGALIKMAAWLSVAYDLPVEKISGHRDHAITTCPGNLFYDAYLGNGLLIELVRQQIQGGS